MTLVEVVNERLHQMFIQLADDIGTDRLGLNLTQDEVAGIPFALFSAEQTMRSAFERFVTRSAD